MPPDAFHQNKTALLGLGGHRVWSLMVTLFGDLAQTQGSTIDGPTLSAIMAEMDIRPEAVRVALHRLRNDGWIDSEKSGRTGRHALSAAAYAQTTHASARIYASPAARSANWTLALTQDTGSEDQMIAQGFLPLAPRLYLGAADAVAPKTALVLKGAPVPDWLRHEIAPLMLEAEYAALLPLLEEVERSMHGQTLSPIETATLRCLLVHNWRRIVLRHPPLPPELLPADWSGHACHQLVDTLLTRFPRPAMNIILPS